MEILLFLPILTLIFHPSHCKTILVDGASEWEKPTVHVGDSVIFNHRHHYELYVFQNRAAFSLCNFSRATLLTKSRSTYFKWKPSRLGFFYFSFRNNGSLDACKQGQKLAIEVLPTTPQENEGPSPAALPPITASAPSSVGGVIPSPPPYPWPFRPHEKPWRSRGASPPAAAEPSVPYDGTPFINSNPAVPLPTGEVDSATIRPLPISGNRQPQVVGVLAVQVPLCCMLVLLML